MTSVQLRSPVLDDAQELAELHVRIWRQAFSEWTPANYFDSDFRSSREALWTDWLTRSTPGHCLVVAEVAGLLVGFAHSGPGDAGPVERELLALYLEQSQHGTGAGQALLDAVLGREEPAHLWTARDNARAVAFYTRNGFHFTRRELVSAPLTRLVRVEMSR